MGATILSTHAGWPDTCKRDMGYFDQRNAWLDFRGTLMVGAKAHFGFEVMLITASHGLSEEEGIAGAHFTLTRVDDFAWVANRAVLYNCHIMEHGVVGAGAVVKGVVVPPWTLAEGNPAMLVAEWWLGQWRRISPREPEAFTDGHAAHPLDFWRR